MNDHDLVDRIRSDDDDEAFNLLYTKNQADILRFIHSLFQKFSIPKDFSVTPEDVAQTVWSRFHKHIQKKDRNEVNDVKKYLMGMAHHEVYHLKDKIERERRIEERMAIEVTQEDKRDAERADVTQILEDESTLEILSPCERLIVNLTFRFDLKPNQIQKLMGNPIGSLYAAKSKALAEITRFIKSDNYEYRDLQKKVIREESRAETFANIKDSSELHVLCENYLGNYPLIYHQDVIIPEQFMTDKIIYSIAANLPAKSESSYWYLFEIYIGNKKLEISRVQYSCLSSFDDEEARNKKIKRLFGMNDGQQVTNIPKHYADNKDIGILKLYSYDHYTNDLVPALMFKAKNPLDTYRPGDYDDEEEEEDGKEAR